MDLDPSQQLAAAQAPETAGITPAPGPPATEEAEAGSSEDGELDVDGYLVDAESGISGEDSGAGEEEAAPLTDPGHSPADVDEAESGSGVEMSADDPGEQGSAEEPEPGEAAPVDFDAEAPWLEVDATGVADEIDETDETDPFTDSGVIDIQDVVIEDRTGFPVDPWTAGTTEEPAEQEQQPSAGEAIEGTTTGSTTGTSTGTTGTTTDTTGTTGTVTVFPNETETGSGVDVDVDTGANASGAVDVDVSTTTDADTDASGVDETGSVDQDWDHDYDSLPATGGPDDFPEPDPPVIDTAAGHELPALQGSGSGVQEPPFEVQRRQAIREALRALGDGFIAWTPAVKMRQGRGEVVRVRISEESLPELIWEMPEGTETQVDPVRTSSSMIVRLKGSEEAFRIRSLSGEQQAIASPFTEWTWEVTPLTSGRHRLDLEVVAKFWLAEDDSEQLARVKHADIDVDVDPWYSTRIFASRNWQWLLSSPAILFLLGWIARKVFIKPERRAGF